MMTQRLPETQKIIDYLSRVPYGETASFRDIASACEVDLSVKRHLIDSSIKTLATEGVYFKSVRGTGYRRLHPDQGVDTVRKWHNGQQHRSTHKMSKQLNGANPSHLSPSGRKSLESGLNEVWFRKQVESKLLREEARKAQRNKADEAQKEVQERLNLQHQKFLEGLENQQGS